MKFSAVLFVFASLAVPAASSSLWDHETGLCTAKYTSKDGQDVVLEPKGCTHASYTKTFDEVSMLSAKEVKTAIAAIPDDALYVDLTNYKLEDEDFDDEIMSLLKRLKKLTYFSIFKNYLGDSTMEKAAKVWGKSKTITALDLGRNCCGTNQWTPKALVHVANGLRTNTHLQSLSLNGLRTIDMTGITALLSAVSDHPALTLLTLEWNSIGSWAGVLFSKLLKKNKSLKSLLLQGNDMKNGIKDLATGLRYNSVLEMLDVGSQLNDEGARALAASINHATKPYSKVTQVIFDSTNVSKEAEVELREALARNTLPEASQDAYYAEQAKIAAEKRKLKKEEKKKKKLAKKDGGGKSSGSGTELVKPGADEDGEDDDDDDEEKKDGKWTVDAIDKDEL